jgi:hypothetical protein
MTTGPRRRARVDTGWQAAEAAFPALRAFLSGYLHQDFALEHASPTDALNAFLASASDEERDALRRDWHAFVAASKDRSWRDLRQAFSDLGGAWRPPSRAVLHELFATLDQRPEERRKT